MAEGRNTEVELLARLSELEAEVDSLRDRAQIENLVSRYQYYLTAGEGRRILDELWSHQRADVSFEAGPSGVFVGLEHVSNYYRKERRPGRLMIHAATTPDIAVSSGRDTAEGLWTLFGSEGEAGDLGSSPPETYEGRQLLSSTDEEGRKYRAEWVWQKFHADFVCEGREWKIWHLHLYEIFRCPYDMDWIHYSRLREKTDGLRCDALFTPEIEPNLPPGFPREYNPDYGSTYHWQYSVDAVPELEPQPPAAENSSTGGAGETEKS